MLMFLPTYNQNLFLYIRLQQRRIQGHVCPNGPTPPPYLGPGATLAKLREI